MPTEQHCAKGRSTWGHGTGADAFCSRNRNQPLLPLRPRRTRSLGDVTEGISALSCSWSLATTRSRRFEPQGFVSQGLLLPSDEAPAE